jgi:aminoglycoside 6'-N-acetyltransferase
VIAFEPLRREHLSLMRDWLGREHVRRWWRDDVEESIATYEQEIAGGGDPTENFLIVIDGRPVGFIQT